MNLSHTKIRTYLFCPRAYWFKYIEQIPSRPSAALVFGKAIHATIRELHLSDEMTHSAAMTSFSNLWSELLLQDDPLFKDPKWPAAAYVALAQDILERYVLRQQGQPAPLVVEYEFAIEQVLPDGTQHTVTGIIDRIDEEPDGLVIWDFKSGRNRPNPKDVASDLQLTIYSWAAEQSLGRRVVQCIYYHLRKGERFPTERTPMDHERLLTEVIPNVVRGIEAKAFAGVYDWRCKMCDFRQICQPEQFPNHHHKE